MKLKLEPEGGIQNVNILNWISSDQWGIQTSMKPVDQSTLKIQQLSVESGQKSGPKIEYNV